LLNLKFQASGYKDKEDKANMDFCNFDCQGARFLKFTTYINNNKIEFLSKFESLKCNSFGFIQNIKLLHILIHEQYFILSWIYHKLCHNEWFKKALEAYLH
jgi:hypothetical protein